MNGHTAGGIFLLLCIILAYCSSLHNIDLIFNAKHIDNLEDTNGIVTQKAKDIYLNSYMVMWFVPLGVFIAVALIYAGGVIHGKRI